MNETEQIESVFGGKDASESANGANEKDARIAELERELQKQRVEAGRLKKTNEELSALRDEVAKLKEQKDMESAIADLPENIRTDVPEDFLRASGAMAARMTAKQDEEIRMLREENARRDRNAFTSRINMEYPGFLASVAVGGEKHDAWTKYQRYNAQTIVNALNANDFDTIAYHIERFCGEIGVPVPSGSGGSATPDPRAIGGGMGGERVVSGKVYTSDEYYRLYDDLEIARDKGDVEKMKHINSEIQKAPAEGRVR